MVRAFRNNRRHQKRFEEDINPTDGLINLVDIMLVFSCGLLLSLVAAWNVDLPKQNMQALEMKKDVSKIDEIQKNIEKSETGGTGYEKMGTVFRDPNTGQLYMLKGE
jgi:hypothetical protein